MSFCRKFGDKVFTGSFLWWQHEARLSPNLIKGSDPLHGDLWKWPCSTVMKDEESVHCFTQIDDGDSVREPLTTKHTQPISLYIVGIGFFSHPPCSVFFLGGVRGWRGGRGWGWG